MQTCQRTKCIFLEFPTSKAMRAEANRHDRDLRKLMAYQIANEACHNTAAKRCQQVDQ